MQFASRPYFILLLDTSNGCSDSVLLANPIDCYLGLQSLVWSPNETSSKRSYFSPCVPGPKWRKRVGIKAKLSPPLSLSILSTFLKPFCDNTSTLFKPSLNNTPFSSHLHLSQAIVLKGIFSVGSNPPSKNQEKIILVIPFVPAPCCAPKETWPGFSQLCGCYHLKCMASISHLKSGFVFGMCLKLQLES